MNPTTKSVSFGLLCCVAIYGCSKSQIQSNTDLSFGPQHTSEALFTTDTRKSPFYGDSVLYLNGSLPSNYLFSPVNKLFAGRYISWPAGLSVDAQTGVIDASKSEPGSRYNIGFVSAATGDTAYSQVILAGVTYPDGIYYMDSPDPVLQPWYNTHSPWTGNTTGTNQGTAGLFDENGPASLRAIDQQLLVNASTGAIDLKASVQQGLFGSNPQNGDMKEIFVYYRLNDRSGMALQKTTLILHYYNTLSDVPAGLAASCQASQSALQQIVTHGGSNEYAGEKSGIAVAPPTAKALASTPAPVPAPVAPRPPQIVIVNVGHR